MIRIRVSVYLNSTECTGTYVGRDSSVDGPGIESRWVARFSTTVHTGHGAHPSYTMGTGSFPGVKRPGRGVDHPHPSSDEVKERIELLPLLPLWASMACYRVKFTGTCLSSSSIGTATLVGFGLLNYHWAFSAGRFLQSAVASGKSNPPTWRTSD